MQSLSARMPASIDLVIGKLLRIGGAILLVLTAGLLCGETRRKRESIPSTYSSGSGGARPLLLLQIFTSNVRSGASPTRAPGYPEELS